VLNARIQCNSPTEPEPLKTRLWAAALSRVDADGNANRGEAAKILARPEYVGADAEVIAKSMTGTFEYEKSDRRAVPDFNVFFRYFATYPYYSDAVWYLTQMRRWGQITEAKPDAWYVETVAKVHRAVPSDKNYETAVQQPVAARDSMACASSARASLSNSEAFTRLA
jgi:hypothetical protein